MDIILYLAMMLFIFVIITYNLLGKSFELICVLTLIIGLCIFGLRFNIESISYITSTQLTINQEEINFTNPVKIKVTKTSKKFGSPICDSYKYEILN